MFNVFSGFKMIIDPYLKIAEYIHIVDERQVRRGVGVEVLMYLSIRVSFGAHIIEMITGLKVFPITKYLITCTFFDFLF